MLLLEHRNTAVLGLGYTADKAELTAMTVMSMKDGSHWEVFQGERLITGGIQGFYGLAERSGHWYGYFGGITLDKSSTFATPNYLNNTHPVLYEVDLVSAKIHPIAKRAENDSVRREWTLNADGTVAATFDFVANVLGAWTCRNAAGAVIASGKNKGGRIGLMGLGRSSASILYYERDEATNIAHYYEIPRAGGPPVEQLPDVATVEALFDKQTRNFIGYLSEEDYPQKRFFNEGRNGVVRAIAKAFPGRHADLMDSSDDFRRHVVRTEGLADPGTWWFVDINTGSAIPLGTSYQVPGAQVGAVSVVKYHAGDGIAVEGVLTLPPGKEAKNLPVIVLPHGGPAGRDYPRFDWWAQAFAVQGYAVFQPNFRGSTGYGADFEKAGHTEWGRKMQTDISDGLAELAHQGIVGAKRACIMGGSYGGYAALAGVTLQQGLYRCAVSVAGIGDVAEMYNTDVTESGRDLTMIHALHETLGASRKFDAVSPINFANRADAPILLIHGKDDTVVSYSQSTSMEKALRRAGKPVELITLNGEDPFSPRAPRDWRCSAGPPSSSASTTRPTDRRYDFPGGILAGFPRPPERAPRRPSSPAADALPVCRGRSFRLESRSANR